MSNNPWDANECVERMEGISEVMGCTDQQNVVLCLKLEGDAKTWLKVTKKTFEDSETHIT